ncbi:MAG: acylphosphatase [Candidatus Pacebacteria bacterium]|nr:acylphosphatase [Candidatus Paceibacterota bacterium]MDD3072452.1 acylphosphatase [Candidatus Paceibacterota bacterium]MDD3729244.1 acylphosphatase [Candidatus Paceibacterota bacterium]MDD4201283.1 acylphosphatase [Candidatus Paceibacterota bacterium]MDD4467396.1 acylphosphatase [Candidatus Paceibacterota bacterium]
MENKNKVRAHVFFSGRVQRVFFRRTVMLKANLLKITGWIKNLKDGRVEAVFEGEKEKIEKLVKNAGKGNPLIRVDYFELEWEKYSGQYENFKVTY